MTYNVNGQLIFTAVPGTSYTGLYNVNGSYNVVLTTENTTYKGAYHPCGALWGTSYSGASQANYQAIDGSINISSNGDGTYSPIYPLGGAGDGPSPKQIQGGVIEGSGTTIGLTLGATVGAANLIAGQIAFLSGNLLSIVDDKANSYVPVDTVSGNGLTIVSFYLANITNGPKTITATFSASQVFSSLIVDEYSNIAASSPLDNHQIKYQPSIPSGNDGISSGAAITQFSGDLIYGAMNGPGDAIAAGSNFTLRQATGDGEHSEDMVQAAAGSISATFTFAPGAVSSAWSAMMAFKRKGAPTGGNFFASDGASSPVDSTQCGLYVASTNTTWFTWEGWEQVNGVYQRVAMVTTYNHATGTWSPNVIAGTVTLTGDLHGTPALARDTATGYVYLTYGAHTSSTQISYTTNPDDPSAWSTTSLASGTYGAMTFPTPFVIGGKLYIFWNGSGTGSSAQESLKVVVGTINGSTGALSFGSVSNLVDTGGTTWLLEAWTSIQISSTKVAFFLLGGPIYPTSNTPNSYFVVVDVSTLNVSNVGGGTVIVPGSQPVNLASLNANFAVYSNTSLWVLRFAVDGGGTTRCFIVDFSAAIPVLYETHWTGSVWSTPLLIYTFPTGMPGNICPVVNSAGGVDIYFTDGSFPGLVSQYVQGGGNLLRRTVTSAGVWDSGPTTVFSYGVYPIFGMTSVVAASAPARLVFGEASLGGPTIAANLRVRALGDSGFISRP